MEDLIFRTGKKKKAQHRIGYIESAATEENFFRHTKFYYT